MSRHLASGCAAAVALAVIVPVAASAAELQVTNTNDAGPGSLRAALATAEANGEADVITITVAGAIELGSALPELTTELDIVGPSAGQITITRAAGAPEFRILTLAASTNVELADLTIAGGHAFGSDLEIGSGGGILSRGRLRLTRVVVEDNVAETDENNAFGGGIYADGGSLAIEDSTIRDNLALGTPMPWGGGGGGVFMQNGATLTLRRSTVSGNDASGFSGVGGAIVLASGAKATIRSTTIADNGANGPCCTICTATGSATVVAQNSIIANGPCFDEETPVCSGPLDSAGYNLVSDESCGLDGVADQQGVDPMLAPLADNGGPTPTHQPLPGSPARDKGHWGGQRTDQRGVVRVIDEPAIPNAPSGGGADIGAYETGGLAPAGAEVDYEAGPASDGNGVLEPGEQVPLAPVWQNAGTEPVAVSTGVASNFRGEAGAEYNLLASTVAYTPPGAAETMSCRDQPTCYLVEVLLLGPRPSPHMDAMLEETLDDADDTQHTWFLHLGGSFTDVPRTSPFYPAIETLLHRRVTEGCTGTAYCPSAANSRDQMPVFLLRALEGRSYNPPFCVPGEEMFADVPFNNTFCRWIEELARRSVTAGCGGGNYCPNASVRRDQMAVFLLKTLEGPGYTPPPCAGVFNDVLCPSLFANWVEDLVARGITAGCGAGNYCPSGPVSRDQMAAFLAKTFGLSLYPPRP